MTLYIGSPLDAPHTLGTRYGTTKCGLPTGHMKAITENQALVWLGNRRCHDCHPGWESLHAVRRSAV